jgi:hypothetical protein
VSDSGKGRTRLDAARDQACVATHAGRARALATWRAWRRMLRGCLIAKGEFGCNLAETAVVFLTDGQH